MSDNCTHLNVSNLGINDTLGGAPFTFVIDRSTMTVFRTESEGNYLMPRDIVSACESISPSRTPSSW
jgi:hypothetical protein